MALQRIQGARQPYRIREDVRTEPIRLGKYLYLALLGVVALTIVHLSFGHLYLLRGDGFVYGPTEVAALEFDATVREVAVEEGERVEPGTVLFTYQSTDLEKDLTTLALRISQLERTLSDDRIRLTETEANLRAARRYVRFATALDEEMQQLRERGLVTAPQISSEAKKSFEAREALVGYRARREQLRSNIDRLAEAIGRVRTHYDRLVALYDEGRARAHTGGVVSGLRVARGAVLTRGEPALRIFGPERYVLAYFDERSLVDFAEGDPVLVSLPGGGWTLGRIRALARVANRLPEEFQPRFKPLQRNQVAEIEVDAEVLARRSILGKVSIYKPFGMEWLAGLAGAG